MILRKYFHSFRRGFRGVLTPLDIVLIVSLLGFSLIGFAFPVRGSGERYIVIELEGSELYRAPLSVERTFSSNGRHGHVYIKVEDGEARVLRSSCPLKFCVNSGPIEVPGQIIVCIPNEVVVRIEAKEGFDAVLR
jgi:hypothetical protein